MEDSDKHHHKICSIELHAAVDLWWQDEKSCVGVTIMSST